MADTQYTSPNPSKAALFADWINDQVRVDGETFEGGKDVRRLKLSTILARCGWARRSDQRMERLAAMLSERGLVATPPLTDRELTVDGWVRFSRRPPPVPVQTPPSEADLIKYLHANHRHIEPLDGYGPNIVREESRPSGKRPDLIIKDAARRRWLVIEVENKGLANHEAPLQLLDYMREIKDRELPAGWEIEGMIISAAADPHHVQMLMDAKAPGPVHWLTFTMQVELQRAPGSVEASGERE